MDELQRGLDRETLRERLGDPTLRTSTVDRGALFETYVYQHTKEGPMIMAYLKDGKLQTVKSSR